MSDVNNVIISSAASAFAGDQTLGMSESEKAEYNETKQGEAAESQWYNHSLTPQEDAVNAGVGYWGAGGTYTNYHEHDSETQSTESDY